MAQFTRVIERILRTIHVKEGLFDNNGEIYIGD